ncbi:hypothetical protein S349_68 [Shewanella sp. phage 3/49]|uniref:hypothetical protein n=1 Tax=Shewanella sp. phage 3/49 TaxID=1458863 RepID=UPI0004F81293|nr:hypothetical protein S349_68 [Shewanella sp. phage 3/49]AHK11858.1 hypothetical protein S349_68 [Shewanella sp. phage 3/49]
MIIYYLSLISFVLIACLLVTGIKTASINEYINELEKDLEDYENQATSNKEV